MILFSHIYYRRVSYIEIKEGFYAENLSQPIGTGV